MNHGWEYRKLYDVAPAKSFDGEIAPCEDKYWCLNLDKIESDTGRIIEYDYLESGDLHGSICKFSTENVLFSKLRPNLNKVVVPMQDGYCTTELVPLHPIKELNREFLSYYLRNPRFVKALVDKTGGAKMPRVKMNLFWECEIPLPKLEIQNRIVSELDKINELIEVKRSQLADLDELAQSLFYEIFGDPIENPKGWEISTIGDVASVQTGATPSREINEYYNGDIPWVKTTEVKNCDIYETEEHISQNALKNSNCKLFPLDTIIVAMYGQGKTRGQIARLKIEACTNQACAAILPCSKLHPLFLYAFLHVSYESLRSIAVGCNQKNLNLSLVKNYPIFLPTISLQNEFAIKVEAIEEQKRLTESSIADLQTILASRMDYWFND